MKDIRFKLDSVIDLTRYVGQDHYQTKLDDKSAYAHVGLHLNTRQWLEFQWSGWFVNNVLPFGWKISPYVYQTLGMVATKVLRN